MARPKKTFDPETKLIPIEDLKQVVRGLIAVPKDEIDKAEAERPKRKRRPPGQR
jgi:hypothetical protein